MAVSDNKLIKGVRRFSTTIGSGGVANDSATTVPLSSIPATFSDGDAIEFIVDRVSTAGALTTSYEETIVGEVSGSNVINCARGVEGTAQAHSAGAVVEIKLTADMWNRIVGWGLVEHGQDGTHDNTKIVKMTGNQTIAGVKTFSSSPVVPAPTTDLQAATKKYVDDNAGAGGKFMFIIPGTASTGTDVAGTWFTPGAGTITSVDLFADTAGATGNTVVDILLDGTTIFPSTAKPTLADTAVADVGNVPDTAAFTASQKVTVDITGVTTTPQTDLYVVIKYSE